MQETLLVARNVLSWLRILIKNNRPKGGVRNMHRNLWSESFFFFNKFIYLFIYFYFWLRWVFVAAHGLSLVAASRVYSSLRCADFSLRWLLLLQSMGSRRVSFSSCGSWALERRLSSCGARAQLLSGMWDLPGRGLEPMSPALAGRFLTTAPPGKPLWSES